MNIPGGPKVAGSKGKRHDTLKGGDVGWNLESQPDFKRRIANNVQKTTALLCV